MQTCRKENILGKKYMILNPAMNHSGVNESAVHVLLLSFEVLSSFPLCGCGDMGVSGMLLVNSFNLKGEKMRQ